MLFPDLYHVGTFNNKSKYYLHCLCYFLYMDFLSDDFNRLIQSSLESSLEKNLRKMIISSTIKD